MKHMRSKYYSVLGVLVFIYVVLVFATPPAPAVLAMYHITALQLRLIDVLLLIPILAIYFVAFYGFITMKDYVSHIKDYPDGAGFKLLSDGLAILAIGMVINSVTSAAINLITSHNTRYIPTGVILTNYVSLAFAAACFYCIYRGSLRLTKLTDASTPTWTIVVGTSVYVLLGAGFTVIALSNPDRSAVATATTHGVYYLPNWLLLPTLILPYLIVWYFGLLGARNIGWYRQSVKGVIYKTLLRNLAIGITLIIVSSIIAQMLNQFPRSFQNLSLHWLLGVLFLFLGLIAAGFVMVAIGAKKLRQLEGL